jgi:hypothetical protein
MKYSEPKIFFGGHASLHWYMYLNFQVETSPSLRRDTASRCWRLASDAAYPDQGTNNIDLGANKHRQTNQAPLLLQMQQLQNFMPVQIGK